MERKKNRGRVEKTDVAAASLKNGSAQKKAQGYRGVDAPASGQGRVVGRRLFVRRREVVGPRFGWLGFESARIHRVSNRKQVLLLKIGPNFQLSSFERVTPISIRGGENKCTDINIKTKKALTSVD